MKLSSLYLFALLVTLQSTLALPRPAAGLSSNQICAAACCGDEEENTEAGDQRGSRPCNPFQCPSCCPVIPGSFRFILLPPPDPGRGPEPALNPFYNFDLHFRCWHPPRRRA